MIKISKFNAADYLKTPAALAAYLDEAFEIDDPTYTRIALNTVARESGGRSRKQKAEEEVANKKAPAKPGPFDIREIPGDQRE